MHAPNALDVIAATVNAAQAVATARALVQQLEHTDLAVALLCAATLERLALDAPEHITERLEALADVARPIAAH
jgi:hypothetical protein